jgi:hypothetical protein
LPIAARSEAPRHAPPSPPLDEPPDEPLPEELPLPPLDPPEPAPLELPLPPPEPPLPPPLPPLDPASPTAFDPLDDPPQLAAAAATVAKAARMSPIRVMNASLPLASLVRDVDPGPTEVADVIARARLA